MDNDLTQKVGDTLLDYYLTDKKMNNGIFKLSWGNVRSALVSAFVLGFLGMAGYVIGVGDIFNLNFHVLANTGVLAILVAIVSLLKNFLTTDSGKFVNAVDTNA